jgi:hypothetical protein
LSVLPINDKINNTVEKSADSIDDKKVTDKEESIDMKANKEETIAFDDNPTGQLPLSDIISTMKENAGGDNIIEIAKEFNQQQTGELQKVTPQDTGTIPVETTEAVNQAVQNIVSDEAVEHTAPIVLDAEQIATEAQALVDDPNIQDTQEIAAAVVEEMSAVSELDDEECKSFTGEFMPVKSSKKK